MTNSPLKGFLLDEIDDAARDIIQHLAEIETPSAMCLLALCRAIVMVNPDQLDIACRVIDELSEVPVDVPFSIEED